MSMKSQPGDNFLLSKILFLVIIFFFTFQGCKKVDSLLNDSIKENNSGNYEEAIKKLKEILTIDKENPLYLNNLGWTLFRNENFEEAKKTLEKAKAKCKNRILMDSIEINLFMVSTFQKGIELLEKQNYDEAVTEFEKVTSKYYTKELELKYLALCYEGLGKHDEANKKWKGIVEMYKNSDIQNKFYLLATEKLPKEEESNN